jgi:hypothetical protein
MISPIAMPLARLFFKVKPVGCDIIVCDCIPLSIRPTARRAPRRGLTARQVAGRIGAACDVPAASLPFAHHVRPVPPGESSPKTGSGQA